ncbi:Forkhead box protein N3 [Microtus ochrogaster]|uniref:Forkhead box protein N3 n=1 Tax=Microtus ochrogaster TaxID=79684 RepID=A0A8J6KL98_MICOH|nr:Forkhead box protein N3 [Microtus ochrogaster]
MGPVMPASKKPESSGISVSSGLSPCYRGSGFSKALQEDDDLDFPLPDIRLEEGTMEDEELTNLNWLHESKNLLKSFGESVLRSVSPVQDLDDDTPPSPAHSDMPYDARQNPNCKPPYSFSCLIFMAIEDSPTKRLPVKDIYNWILEHFPYFANAPTGWKNSVRHNLSLNKCFKKVDKERSQTRSGCPPATTAFFGVSFLLPAALKCPRVTGNSGPLIQGEVNWCAATLLADDVLCEAVVEPCWDLEGDVGQQMQSQGSPASPDGASAFLSKVSVLNLQDGPSCLDIGLH